MGIKLKPREFGNDCLACWPANETPAFVYIAFSGVKPGDVPDSFQLPNNHWFKCDQDPGNSCKFVYNVGGPGFIITLFRSIATGRWHVTGFKDAHSLFTGFVFGCPSELSVWSNLQWSPIFFKGWDGYAYCFWIETALDLASAFEMPLDGGLFLEVFLKNGTNLVYKFCNTKYSLNQTIELP